MFKLKERALGLMPLFAFANPGPNITSTPLLDQAGEDFAPTGGLSVGDGKQLGQSPLTPVGVWGHLPVVQPATTSVNVHTPAAGAVTAVFVNTTFDGAFVAYTGNTTLGSSLVTGMSSVAGLFVGMSITGTGIPAGSFIGLISGSTIGLVNSLGAPVLATATGAAVTFAIGGAKAYTIGDIVTALKLCGILAL